MKERLTVSYEWIDGLGLGHVSHCFLLRNAFWPLSSVTEDMDFPRRSTSSSLVHHHLAWPAASASAHAHAHAHHRRHAHGCSCSPFPAFGWCWQATLVWSNEFHSLSLSLSLLMSEPHVAVSWKSKADWLRRKYQELNELLNEQISNYQLLSIGNQKDLFWILY